MCPLSAYSLSNLVEDIAKQTGSSLGVLQAFTNDGIAKSYKVFALTGSRRVCVFDEIQLIFKVFRNVTLRFKLRKRHFEVSNR